MIQEGKRKELNIIYDDDEPDLIQQAVQRNDEAALEIHLQRQIKLQTNSNPLTRSATQSSSSLSFTALHVASALGFDGAVRQLLQSGYIVHTRDYSNHTPLFLAARNGHFSTVDLLRSAGAHLSTEEVDLARYYLTRAVAQPDANNVMQIWSAAGLPLQ